MPRLDFVSAAKYKIILIIIFLNFDLYKLNIQIQISLMIGNLHLADLLTDNFSKNRQNRDILYIYEQANGGKKAVNKKEVPG